MEFSVPAIMALIIVRFIIGALLPALLVAGGVSALSRNPKAALYFGGATFLALLALGQ